MNDVQTLPTLLFKHAQERPNDIALRWKRQGKWKVITWGEYANNAKQVVLGLERLGIKKGDIVAFLFRNPPEWIYLELGAMTMGILPFGIFSEIEDREMIYHYLNLSDSRVVLAENQEQTDKVLDLKKRLPKIQHIVVLVVPEFKEVAHYHDPIFMSFDELFELGKEEHKNNPDKQEEAVKKLDPDGPCLLSTTSGTTGLPKMALLSHQNFISMAQGMNKVDPVKSYQNYVSSLTTAWVGEHWIYSKFCGIQ